MYQLTCSVWKEIEILLRFIDHIWMTIYNKILQAKCTGRLYTLVATRCETCNIENLTNETKWVACILYGQLDITTELHV